MRMTLIAATCATSMAALAWAGPAEKPCCDLWIFEPEHGAELRSGAQGPLGVDGGGGLGGGRADA